MKYLPDNNRQTSYSSVAYFLLACAMVFLTTCSSPAVITDTQVRQEGIEQKVDSLLSLMTLEEKIGQMTLYTSDFDQTGPTIREGYQEDIREGRVGAIFNAYGAEFNEELQRTAVEETRLGIPLLFGYDVIHGHKTIFPIPLGEAASWNLELMEETARIAALEATAQGLHWTFAPMVDISLDPRWGRIAESPGEDPLLGSEIAKAKVRGFQGDSLASHQTLLATAKHFAAYGAAQAGRDYHTVDISERTLREIYLPPFKAAVEAGAGSFMTAFNEIAGVPATASEFLFTEILRNEWGFDGFVVSDYTAINELIPHGVASDSAHAGELAVKAGVDMDMQGAIYHFHLADMVEQGIVPEETIDESVRRILRYKFRLGLFEDPYRYSDESREEELILNERHLKVARDMARESIVLLKNNNILPLDKNIENLAVIGPLADNQQELIGSWSAAGDYTDAVTLLDGIKQTVSENTEVLHAKGANINGDDRSGFEKAIKTARQSDAVVLALGEAAQMSGEAASRSEIDLPGVQQELIREILKTGKPVVLVLMNGRPLDLTWENEHVPAILETWFAGTMAGPAIADVLFGDYNPSGKLTATFPRSVGQVPIHYNMKNTGRPFDVDNKYTSKYLDVPNEPLYPFGYGLSYTTFEYSDITLDKTELSGSDSLRVSVEVTNTGDMSGEEVVQLYMRDLTASVTRPVKELKGFRKIALEAGEMKEVTFILSEDDLAFYDINMERTAEPGRFKVFVGTNSRDVKEAEFLYTE